MLVQECSRVSLGLAARTSQGRLSFPGDTAYSSELVKYDSSCKGEGYLPYKKKVILCCVVTENPSLVSDFTTGSHNATEASLRIFRSCFGTYLL